MKPILYLWIKKFVADFFGYHNNDSVLYKINGQNGISCDIFQSLIYNSGEGLYAHTQGAYTNIFNIGLIDVFKLSSRYWVTKLPDKNDSILMIILRLYLCFILMMFGWLRRWLPFVPSEA